MLTSSWARRVGQPLIVAAMMASLAVSVVQLLQLIVPTWDGTYLTVVIFLTMLESMASNRLIRRHRLSSGEILAFRAGEWLLVLMALKLGTYAARGVGALLADLAIWRQDPSALFTIEYVVAIVLTATTWLMASNIEVDLAVLGEPAAGLAIDREVVFSRLVTQFFLGGVILILAAGITRIGVAELVRIAHPPVHGVVLNALVYFVLGLLLMAQARLLILEVRWAAQEVPAASDISSRWTRASLVFIVGVGMVALVLPRTYSFGLLESLGIVLGYVLAAATLLFSVLLLLVTFPFALLFRLLGGTVPQQLQFEPPTVPPALPPAGGEGSPLLAFLRSLLFWGLILGIAVYALRSYFKYRTGLLGAAGDGWLHRLWAALREMWHAAWRSAGRTLQPLRHRLAERLPQLPQADIPRWAWRRLASMSVRERIQYYYLSIVQRGQRTGRPRQPHETPFEYSAALRLSRPEVEPDLTELTQAFVEAKYSPHTIPEERDSVLRHSWNRVKRILRRSSPPGSAASRRHAK
jgi:hypothetical protein